MVKITSDKGMVAVELKGNGCFVLNEAAAAIATTLANLHRQMVSDSENKTEIESFIAAQRAEQDIKHILMQSYLQYQAELIKENLIKNEEAEGGN